jgi:glucose/arabinose dehydrogenase
VGLAVLAALVALLGGLMAGAPTTRAEDDLVAHTLKIPLTNGTRTVTLWVARGLDIGVAATGVPSARVIAQSPSGELVVSQMFEGTVSQLADHDGDGVFEDRTAILRNVEVPHGLAFAGDALFVATTDRILRLDRWWDGSSAHEVAKLPGWGTHQTRTLALGPDGKLYVSIGSSCDACADPDGRRAAILRMDPAGGAAGAGRQRHPQRRWDDLEPVRRPALGDRERPQRARRRHPAGRGGRREGGGRLRLAGLLRRSRPGQLGRAA